METIKIEGKKYVIKEPTLKEWKKILLLKDELTENDLNVELLFLLSDIEHEKILDLPADKIQEISSILAKYFNDDAKKIFQEIEHNGIEYDLVDMNKISFGQFVDIDTFLSKDESYRIKNLNELAAYLYTEKGTSYSDSDFQKRINEFEDLPVKYVEGAIFFLTTLGRALQTSIVLSSQNRWSLQMAKMIIALVSIGDGIRRYLTWLKIVLKKLMLLLTYPFYLVLTTLRILLTPLKRKKKQ